MSSSATAVWSGKLKEKLSKLVESSSKESLQTLAQWMAFHRKHAAAFAETLRQGWTEAAAASSSSSPGRQVLLLTILHEVLLLESPGKDASSSAHHHTGKFERLEPLRVTLGESALLPVIPLLSETARNKLQETMLPVWDDARVFGLPTLIQQIRKKLDQTAGQLSSSSSSPTKRNEMEATSVKSSPSGQASSRTTPTKGEEEEVRDDLAGYNLDNNNKLDADSKAAGAGSDDSSAAQARIQSSNTHVEGVNFAHTVPEATSAVETPPPHASALFAHRRQEETEDMDLMVTLSQDLAETDTPMASSSPLAKSDTAGLHTPSPATDTPTSSLPTPASTSSSSSSWVYDFESKGIPAEVVDPREFSEPCRAIATFQIARDLRSDEAVQLSSLLSTLPEEVRVACAERAEQGTDYILTQQQARQFVRLTKDVITELDLAEQWQNVRTFRDLVQRQRQARLQLIELLIKSRCQFGAREAAEAFFQADRAREEIKKRKQILADAMDLEGIDVADIEKDRPQKAMSWEAESGVLPPLTWYRPRDNMEPNLEGAKRSKLE